MPNNKAVLLNIRPEWCEKILSGEKTVEIRKTRPKLEPPFKCYIYCTLAGSDSLFVNVLNRGCGRVEPWRMARKNGTCHWRVHLRMTSDALALNTVSSKKISSLQFLEAVSQYRKSKTMPDGSPGMSYADLKDLYGWNISDLKIYDQPRLLSNFTRLRATKFGYEPVDIERPLQSWFYVEDGR